MKIEWVIDKQDVAAVAAVRGQTERNNFVQYRIRRNVEERTRAFDRARFWSTMIGCLLTTQQRSGPDRPVPRFLNRSPFPLSLGRCERGDAQDLIARVLADGTGVRRGPTIAEQAARNLDWFRKDGWKDVEDWYRALAGLRARPAEAEDAVEERRAARFVAESLAGFGPKQSRNLWQWLGLTRFEIPLDSRITGWLNANGFPVELSASGLSDPNYYEFVLDGVQALCRRAGLLPCVFDACVFSSYDPEWRLEDLED
ncbi:MAG: hypothetical protein HY905_07150 [Deltaproteobacteria bacterium]|nr:hypothetical protein [Deltaproteobacteria bacterium]